VNRVVLLAMHIAGLLICLTTVMTLEG
jgi:hypothetical protein